MKRFIKSAVVAFATVLTCSAATLTWNKNPESGVGYRVHTILNGATNAVAVGTNTAYTIPSIAGSTRSFYVTAYFLESLVESDPSVTVSYSQSPVIPAISATNYTIADFKANQWQGVTVRWGGIDKTQYNFSNYNLVAVAGTTTNVYTTPNTSFTIATLPRATWSFYVFAENSEGRSPFGTALVLNGTKPNAPTNLTVQ